VLRIPPKKTVRTTEEIRKEQSEGPKEEEGDGRPVRHLGGGKNLPFGGEGDEFISFIVVQPRGKPDKWKGTSLFSIVYRKRKNQNVKAENGNSFKEEKKKPFTRLPKISSFRPEAFYAARLLRRKCLTTFTRSYWGKAEGGGRNCPCGFAVT